jgi:GntR family transcriptional repressor for pyruvate dehydrogenase complex
VRRRVRVEVFRPVTTRRAVEDVVGQLVELIRSGQLREGDELPGERVVAAAMEVSRPTVRLAVAALVEAGVAEIQKGRTGGVRIKSMWITEGLLGSVVDELRADETFHLLEARRAIEPRVAQLAALRGTDEAFQAMRESIELQAANTVDRRRAVQAEVMYHRLMWQAAGNPTLEEMLRLLFQRLEVVMDMALRTAPDRGRAVEIHETTLAALMSGEPARVETAMDEHMAYLERIAEDVYGRKRIREVPNFLRGGADAPPRSSD